MSCISMQLNKFLLTCGLPGSGKSTIARKLAERHGYEVVCPDAFRLALNGGAYPSGDRYAALEPVVWSLVEKAVRLFLRRGDGVILDATNLSQLGRDKWVAIARQEVPDIYPLVIYCKQNFDSPQRWLSERGIGETEYYEIRATLESRLEVPTGAQVLLGETL